MHKGDCGRVGIVAGSRGFTGAAVMTANAAVRAGAGLVSLFVTQDIYAPAAAAAMPEVMVTPLDCYLAVLERPLDALAIGPGLGHADAPDILAVIEYFKGPMVVDADALNLLSENPQPLRRAAGPRLLTPHPGEMRRLFHGSANLSRRETAERFLEQNAENASPVTLLLKGSRTLVAERTAGGLRISWNTTGNPGMATGGMGDVLTGTCAALAGQGLSLFDAARVGAWICGRAAELEIASGEQSQESLAATDLPGQFGRAFCDLRDMESY
jgi:NAD(P)H-hydrate epimerase